MKYYKLTITTENIENACEILAARDIFEYQIEDPADLDEIMNNKAGYDWDFIDEKLVEDAGRAIPKINVFFQDEQDADKIRGLFDESVITVTDDEEWKNKYKEHFRAMKLTECICVCPSWDELIDDGSKIIRLDPGMAFGTGDHATTSMCVRMMESYGCAGKCVFDVGTGSGILAIAASMMGADRVIGTDIDETAVAVARENIEKNKLDDRIEVYQADLDSGIDVRADMVVANIVAELVVKLAEGVRTHMKPGGVFICSGILSEKEGMVRDRLEDLGMKIDEVLREDGWCAIGAIYE